MSNEASRREERPTKFVDLDRLGGWNTISKLPTSEAEIGSLKKKVDILDTLVPDCLYIDAELCDYEHSYDSPMIQIAANANKPGGGLFYARAQEEAVMHRTDIVIKHSLPRSYGPYNPNPTSANTPLSKAGYAYRIKGANAYQFHREGTSPAVHNDSFGKPFDAVFVANPDLRKFQPTWTKSVHENYMKAVISNIRLTMEHAYASASKTVILSALGCGCFKNNPFLVAAAYRVVLSEPKYAGIKPYFAIGSPKGYLDPFSQEYSDRFSQELRNIFDLVINQASASDVLALIKGEKLSLEGRKAPSAVIECHPPAMGHCVNDPTPNNSGEPFFIAHTPVSIQEQRERFTFRTKKEELFEDVLRVFIPKEGRESLDPHFEAVLQKCFPGGFIRDNQAFLNNLEHIKQLNDKQLSNTSGGRTGLSALLSEIKKKQGLIDRPYATFLYYQNAFSRDDLRYHSLWKEVDAYIRPDGSFRPFFARVGFRFLRFFGLTRYNVKDAITIQAEPSNAVQQPIPSDNFSPTGKSVRGAEHSCDETPASNITVADEHGAGKSFSSKSP